MKLCRLAVVVCLLLQTTSDAPSPDPFEGIDPEDVYPLSYQTCLDQGECQ